jgi:hypothetical protein
VIAVSGGGWGVGDLVGATGAALSVPDATVLCLCGRNDRLRARVSKRFAGEQRLRVMGFTDRMGDVLAASDALIHSSAGLTVLEALIRGCPVISYGFGYGHVRASNAALKRFGLAQVARKETELKPDLERALEHRPEPDGSFARRPSTASLILNDERRVRPLPAWRTRTARAVTTATAALAVVAWMLTAGSSYRLVSHFVHMRPTTAVQTTLPEVGVLVDAPSSELQSVANALVMNRIRASFALEQPPSRIELGRLGSGDQAIPLLRSGGLVRWLGTRDQLHDVTGRMGFGHHFLYASNGPSVGQWWLAHGAGGELIAGAVRLDDTDDTIPEIHAGQVVELTVSSRSDIDAVVRKLSIALQAEHLQAVPVGRLLHDAGDAV